MHAFLSILFAMKVTSGSDIMHVAVFASQNTDCSDSVSPALYDRRYTVVFIMIVYPIRKTN